MNFSMNIINHIDLTPEFDALYNYKPLLQFMKYIVTNSYKDNFNDLYLSNDYNGNLYAFVGNENDQGFWHIDDSPFSCIWMINKPGNGGNLHYLYIGKNDHDDNNDKWNKIAQIMVQYVKDQTLEYDTEQYITIDDSDVLVKYVDANPRDMYCFKGNVLLHKSSKIKGNEPRIVFVTTYADSADFENTDTIQTEFFTKSNSDTLLSSH